MFRLSVAGQGSREVFFGTSIERKRQEGRA